MESDNTVPSIPNENTKREGHPIAPAWHTVLMVLVILSPLILKTLSGHPGSGDATSSTSHLALYFQGAVVECIFFLFAWWGIRLGKTSLRILLGASWPSRKEFGRDISLAILFWGLWYGILNLLKIGLIGVGITNANASGLSFPQGALEVAVWIPNAILAGIVEELVFRGYLLKQFTAWLRSPSVAVSVQAIIFGAAHGYGFGIRQMILITISGILVGGFVLWRRNLKSAIVFHSWADIFGAVVVKGLPFR